MPDEEKKDETVKETALEMFLITDFNIIKKLLSYASFPSKTYIYQMPDKSDKYVDGSVEKSAELMNTLLEYQRSEEWRVSELEHASEIEIKKKQINGEEREVVEIAYIDKKNSQPYQMVLADIKEAIIVPELHSIALIPAEPLLGNIAPNAIIRLIGLIQHKFFKCILTGEDDPENQGQRTLSMHFEELKTTP